MFWVPPPMGSYGGAPGFNTEDDGPKFTIEALTGMRAWRVNEDGALISPVYSSYEWKPGINYADHGKAYGSYSQTPHTPCPARDCSAGFYAYHSEGYWYSNDRGKNSTGYTSNHPWVSGLIAGWGRVVNGPKGFRCAKATIVALCLPVQKPNCWDRLPQVEKWGSWDAWADQARDLIQDRYSIVPVFESVEDMLARVPLQGAT